MASTGEIRRQAVVSGGGTGIGRAVAAHLAAAGCAVTVLGRRAGVLEQAAGAVGGRAVTVDLADPGSVRRALDELPTDVDVLVNAAGGLAAEPDGDDALDRLAAGWHAAVAAVVLPVALLTAALEPRLRDGARVVTLGSIAARTGGGAYGGAKAALEAWNVDLARRLGPRGITANVVAPGLTVGTEFFRRGLSDERRDRLVAATLTRRPGTPDDVAALVAFLGSVAAGHVTGQVLHVDGGAHRGL